VRRLLARRKTRAHVDALERVSQANGAHVFSGEVRADGAYVETFTGPNLHRFLGGLTEVGWRDAIHPDDRDRFAAAVSPERLRLLVPVEVEYRMVGRDGVTRWVWERLTPRRDGRRLLVDGVAIDVSLARAEREALEASLTAVLAEQKVHAYIGRIRPDGTYVEDYSGPGQEAILGGSPPSGVIDGDLWAARIHPEDLPDVSWETLLGLAEGRYDYTYRMLGLDGITRVVRDRGQVEPLADGTVLLRGIAADVSEQARAEAALATARRQIEEALLGSRAHLFQAELTPERGYDTVYVGPGVEHVLGGLIPEDADVDAGIFWRSRVHEADRDEYDAAIAEQLAGRPAEVEYRLAGVDGVERWVSERTEAEERPGGGVRITGFVRDVTVARVARDDVIAAHEYLERILESVGHAVYIADIETRQVVYHAGPWATILGDRDIGGFFANPGDVVHPEDREAFLAVWETLGRMEPWSGTWRLLSPAGGTAHVRELATPRVTADGRRLVDGLMIDVTAEHLAERELREARDRLARVAESVAEFLFTLIALPDGGFGADYIGPGFERIVGGALPPGLDAHTAWAQRLHRDDAAAFLTFLDRAAERGEAEVEVRVVGYDRVVRWTWIRARARRHESGLFLDGIITDVSEGRRVKEELEQAARVDPLTGAFNRRHFVDVARNVLSGAGAALILLDVDHFKRVNDTYGHATGDAVLVEAVRRLESVLHDEEIVARWGGEELAVLVAASDDAALRDRAGIICAAVRATTVAAGAEAVRITVSCGAALGGGGRTLEELAAIADSALYAAKRRGRDRVCLEIDLVDEDRVPEAPEAIRVAEAMARATAYREGVPPEHCTEVAELASLVASRLGLSAELVLRTRMGAFLHDVGKIAIPDRILTKPGALDDEEWAVMRTHPTIGRDIVLATPGLEIAASGVAHHHERWDGRGYPAGLAGTAIPIEARIVAAADAYSAMTEDRVYRAGMCREDAIVELHRSSGSHLDPDVVVAITDVLGRLEQAAVAA
jgi:diguanylate cyclase (GGDEF)-like protein